MDIKNVINRGRNLLAVTILALSGLSFLPEIFFEDEISHRLDEGLIFILGVIAVSWYLKGKNRFKRSVLPVVLTYIALAVKVMALIIEFSDKQDIGDDFGALILFICAVIVVTWQYRKKSPASL